MTWLKLVVNAAWAGVYGAALIAFLVVFLNTDLASRGLLSGAFVAVTAFALIVFLPILALLLPTLFMILRFFAVRRLTAKWMSLKSTIWFGEVTLVGMTAVVYYNVRWTAALLPPTTLHALRVVAASMAGCSLMGCAVAVTAQFQHRERARRVRWFAGALLLLPVLLMPLLLPRVAGEVRDGGADGGPVSGSVSRGAPRKLLLVGIDAASMDQVLPLISARRLPTLESIAREGISSRLNSIRPCTPGVAWTVLLTGTPPWRSGVRGPAEWTLPAGPVRIQILPRGLGLHALYRMEKMGLREVMEDRRRSASVHEILAQAGRPVHAIGWDGQSPSGSVSAVTLREDLALILGEVAAAGLGEDDPRRGILAQAAAEDRVRHQAALAALSGPPGDGAVVALRLDGLSRVARHFLRYHDPEAFGDVRPDERSVFGRALAGYYEFLDALIGEQVATAGREALVLVVSAYGVEPIPALERFSRFVLRDASGVDASASGSWRRGPDGVLFFRGPGIARAMRFEEADLVDVTPTLLYALGLPIGRDMTGDLRRGVFEPGFLESHAVQYIPSWPLRAMSHRTAPAAGNRESPQPIR